MDIIDMDKYVLIVVSIAALTIGILIGNQLNTFL